ncbi:DUF6515 family protein [Vibrio natriegens]|jgi:hypothetical protein|uniref:DUF6515 family protein n=1 Tax=Vibrio natriegens TaxID=691 RepID=UPI003555C86A
MFNVSTFRNGAIALVLMSMVVPSFAKQAPGLGHGHDHQAPSKVVVVKPDHRPSHKAPSHRSYHHSGLPSTAAILAIAGITYAIIDNAYYKQSGDQYIYVEQPPVSSSQQVNSVSSSLSGQVVNTLPSGVVRVTVDGATYYVRGNDWYAPIAGTSKFVVVAPQL